MPQDEKLKAFRMLEQALVSAEEAARMFKNVWEGQEVRMRIDEIKTVTDRTDKILLACQKVNSIAGEFEEIL